MILFTILEMTAGARKMAETDPHGWILTMIAVCTVFSALVVLYFVYSLIGKISQRGEVPSSPKKTGKKAAGKDPDEQTAAAIAMALEAELGGGTYAAIATALHLYFSQSVHDVEPGIVTIVPRESAWSDKSLTFRKLPRK